MSDNANLATLYLGSGCFWSKEYHLGKLPGVVATRVGFAGGHVAEPTYQRVCTKTTGHAEVVEVTYEEALLPTRELLRTFFSLHDPRIDRRGKGGQYRSIILYTTAAQRDAAQAWLDHFANSGHEVYTELVPATPFWPASDRHQKYCTTKGLTPKPAKGLLDALTEETRRALSPVRRFPRPTLQFG